MVHKDHLTKISPDAAMLYLFLLGVSDRNGSSYYSDGKIMEKTAVVDVARARGKLIEAGLVAYSRPFYQVLSIPEPLCARVATSIPTPVIEARADEQAEMDRILSEFMESCK